VSALLEVYILNIQWGSSANIFSVVKTCRVPNGTPQQQIEAVEMWIFGTTTPRTEQDHVEPIVHKAAPAAATNSETPITPAKAAAAPSAANHAIPAGSIAMAGQSHSARSSVEASSPEGGHGHGHFFKLGSGRKKHTGSISSAYFSSKSSPPDNNPPDHEASSRHVPTATEP
jgi:hypothetical protein